MQHRPSLRRLGSAILFTGACALLGSACNVTVTTDDGDSCLGFEDESRDGAAMVVRNDSEVTVYLSSQNCDTSIEPSIRRDGQALSTADLSCSLTCEELQTQAQVECTAACAAPTIIALAPGGSYPLDWSGSIYVQQTMPEACFFDAFGGSGCQQKTAATDGDYTASIAVYGDIACPEGLDCSCTPNADGYCRVEDLYDVPPAPVEVFADFSLPATDTVAIVIPGPVSCPDTPPENGTACGNPGLFCQWDARNACGLDLDPEALCEDDNTWLVSANLPFCDLECPAQAPVVGSACQPGTDGTYCAYDGPDTCGLLRTCNETTSTWDEIPCAQD